MCKTDVSKVNHCPSSLSLSVSFLLALNPLQEMQLDLLVHAMQIFLHAGLIFQLLVETPCDLQPPVVRRSNKSPNDRKGTILEAVN